MNSSSIRGIKEQLDQQEEHQQQQQQQQHSQLRCLGREAA
jgi:hypothetical protein